MVEQISPMWLGSDWSMDSGASSAKQRTTHAEVPFLSAALFSQLRTHFSRLFVATRLIQQKVHSLNVSLPRFEMSGLEVVGLILGLYPIVVDAVVLCKKVRSGEIVHDLLEDVRAESIIFCNWIQHLCESQLSGPDVLGIVDPESKVFKLWKEDRFLSNLISSRDAQTTTTIVGTLKAIHVELLHIHQDLENLNPTGVSLP